jgi:hypothetical protein
MTDKYLTTQLLEDANRNEVYLHMAAQIEARIAMKYRSTTPDSLHKDTRIKEKNKKHTLLPKYVITTIGRR